MPLFVHGVAPARHLVRLLGKAQASFFEPRTKVFVYLKAIVINLPLGAVFRRPVVIRLECRFSPECLNNCEWVVCHFPAPFRCVCQSMGLIYKTVYKIASVSQKKTKIIYKPLFLLGALGLPLPLPFLPFSARSWLLSALVPKNRCKGLIHGGLSQW